MQGAGRRCAYPPFFAVSNIRETGSEIASTAPQEQLPSYYRLGGKRPGISGQLRGKAPTTSMQSWPGVKRQP